MTALLKTLLPTFCLCLLISCGGRNFDNSWQRSNKKYNIGGKYAVTGPWEGTWLSDSNGHKGKLRCIITPLGGSQESGSYLFRYWATWAGPLQGGFDAEFDIEKMGSQYHVQGTQDLGTFGSFQHEGVIQGENFEATYRSSTGDHGTFNLHRPE